MIFKYIDKIVEKNPFILSLTNFITINDCANIILASGASPMMSYTVDAVKSIADKSNAIVLNMGLIEHLDAMMVASDIANQNNIPVVLDPIAAGSSLYHKEASLKLLNERKIEVVKGNVSEIRGLYQEELSGKGVDAASSDEINDDNIIDYIKMAKCLSDKYETIIAISGKIDLICYKDYISLIRNGVSTMADFTGSGCMLSALIASFIASVDIGNKKEIYDAVVSAFIEMGVAGEIAEDLRLDKKTGNVTFKNDLIDSIYNINFDNFAMREKVTDKINIEVIDEKRIQKFKR